MRALVFAGVLIFALLSAPLQAREKSLLAVDLAKNRVDITTGFNGAHLSLFGVQEEPGDIVITISSPEFPAVVRKKESVFGVWMNRRSMAFRDVPVYYDFASVKSEEELGISRDALRANRIGLSSLQAFEPEGRERDAEMVKSFREALVRNKQASGLFPVKAEPVIFINDRFFRTTFYIPSNVPTGVYVITTYLVKNGSIRDKKTTEVKVERVGSSAMVYDFAHAWSFTYGLLCVLFAASVGWLSNTIRRRFR
jgi:uncharacterized protein (TIGR02186 family)